MTIDIDRFVRQRVLIVGDVNTGKSRYTEAILCALVRSAGAAAVCVIDLAPQLTNGVGGKLTVPEDVRYRTADIIAPRLTARSREEMEQLARDNARRAAECFDAYLQRPQPILVVNDATLFLQAGDPDHFSRLLAAAETAVVNAYYGRHFQDSVLSRRERRRVEALMAACDRTEYLPRP